MTDVALPPYGLWTFHLDLQPTAKAQEAVAELEEQGWGAVWIPEAMGRDPLVYAALLLAASRKIVVATGIASIWARDAMAANASHQTLEEAFPGRFLFGLGVSHQPAVEGLRGHTYERPLAAMRSYLDAMDAAVYAAAKPSTPPRRVLAALGPKMLELAATRAAGAHPYFVPVEHTAFARENLGPDALLAPEQAVVLSADAEQARAIARNHMAIYLTLPNYTNNLRRLGWGDDDLSAGGSDRLVDAIVAWGTVEQVVARLDDHLAAGADHVCVQVLNDDFRALPMADWNNLAQALPLRA
jgi:probable F420-dependent oxidoreductase